jgi:hypothetical protein
MDIEYGIFYWHERANMICYSFTDVLLVVVWITTMHESFADLLCSCECCPINKEEKPPEVL